MGSISKLPKEKLQRILQSLEKALEPDKNYNKMISKNKEWRDSFLEYCIKHPEERFFQALRNWMQKEIDPKINYVYVAPMEDQLDFTDTFYLSPENKDKFLADK